MSWDRTLPEHPMLDEAQAKEFALILLAGAPATHAVRYFLPDPAAEEEVLEAVEAWPSQPEVLEAMREYSGGESWHEMSTKARLDLALTKHYNEMAYFLWTSNYVDLESSERVKADTCRAALEVKVSGLAGQDSPLAKFYHEMLARYDPPGPVS
jgi:hypothetical protein